jgi:hypothetical protein
VVGNATRAMVRRPRCCILPACLLVLWPPAWVCQPHCWPFLSLSALQDCHMATPALSVLVLGLGMALSSKCCCFRSILHLHITAVCLSRMPWQQHPCSSAVIGQQAQRLPAPALAVRAGMRLIQLAMFLLPRPISSTCQWVCCSIQWPAVSAVLFLTLLLPPLQGGGRPPLSSQVAAAPAAPAANVMRLFCVRACWLLVSLVVAWLVRTEGVAVSSSQRARRGHCQLVPGGPLCTLPWAQKQQAGR